MIAKLDVQRKRVRTENTITTEFVTIRFLESPNDTGNQNAEHQGMLEFEYTLTALRRVKYMRRSLSDH